MSAMSYFFYMYMYIHNYRVTILALLHCIGSVFKISNLTYRTSSKNWHENNNIA